MGCRKRNMRRTKRKWQQDTQTVEMHRDAKMKRKICGKRKFNYQQRAFKKIMRQANIIKVKNPDKSSKMGKTKLEENCMV